MSKFKECKSKIIHYEKDKKIIELETSLYIFAESQSSGTADSYDYTVWEWNENKYVIQEVGVHPDL